MGRGGKGVRVRGYLKYPDCVSAWVYMFRTNMENLYNIHDRYAHTATPRGEHWYLELYENMSCA